MCKKKIKLLLLIVGIVNFSYSQQPCGYDGEKYTYTYCSENNDTIFYFPIIFCFNGNVAEFGNVDLILPLQNQDNEKDTIHCYYSFGRIVPEKNDYLRIRDLPDTTSVTMIFRHQTQNKNKTVNTYIFQWSILANRFFVRSPKVYQISYNPNKSCYFTTIYSETGHTSRPIPQKMSKTTK